MCCPSYTVLMAATGLCRQSIANALKRLEASGILKIARRLVREVIDGVMVTRQASNLYSVHEPAEHELCSYFSRMPTVSLWMTGPRRY